MARSILTMCWVVWCVSANSGVCGQSGREPHLRRSSKFTRSLKVTHLTESTQSQRLSNTSKLSTYCTKAVPKEVMCRFMQYVAMSSSWVACSPTAQYATTPVDQLRLCIGLVGLARPAPRKATLWYPWSSLSEIQVTGSVSPRNCLREVLVRGTKNM